MRDDDEGEVEHFASSAQTCNLSGTELGKGLNGKLQELKAARERLARLYLSEDPFRLILLY